MRNIVLGFFLAACGPSMDHRGGADGNGGSGSGSQAGCSAGSTNCFSVYAHSNDTLYVVDFGSKIISRIGKFGISGSMTDLAVAPDNTIYAVSNTAIYTISPATGAATMVGST